MGQQVLPVEILRVLESGVHQALAVIDLVVDLPCDHIRQYAALGRISHLLLAAAAAFAFALALAFARLSSAKSSSEPTSTTPDPVVFLFLSPFG